VQPPAFHVHRAATDLALRLAEDRQARELDEGDDLIRGALGDGIRLDERERALHFNKFFWS